MDSSNMFLGSSVANNRLLATALGVLLLSCSSSVAQVVPQPVETEASATQPVTDQPVTDQPPSPNQQPAATADVSPSDSSDATDSSVASEATAEAKSNVTVTTPAGNAPVVSAEQPTASPDSQVITASAAQVVPAPATVAEPKPQEATQVSASATDAISRDLQNIALQARTQLNAEFLPKVEVSKAKLIEAVARLENYLTTNPNAYAAWVKFLQLDAIKAEIAKEKPDTNVLVDFEMNMRQNYLGLEFQPYIDVRDSLAGLVRALRYGANPEQTIKLLDASLEKLVEALNEPVTDADSTRAESVGIITNYLYESGQVPWAVAAMRGKFSQPNVRVFVPEMFLNRLVSRPVAQPSPVNECLLGTRVVGNAFLSGSVTADLLPSSSGVALSLNLGANMTSNNVGYNRGVVLTSVGSSPIHASKLIHISPAGISSQPATVASNLQTQITSIQHPLRIVRRIARRKADETQPQARAVAEGRLQNRVRSQFEEQVETQLAETRVRMASFQQQPRPEFQRIGLVRPAVSVSSSSDTVYALMTQSSPSQLAATAPSSLPKSIDAVQLEAHQSAVMNAIDTFLGGRTLRNADLDDLVRQFGGKVTPELAEESNSNSWSVTFSTFHPIKVEFDDGLAKLTLRISQMTRGDQILKQNATISASYRPSYVGGNLRLDREGTVDIEFVGRSTGLAAVSMRAFLKGKFEDFFKPVLVDAPVNIGQRFPALPNLQISGIYLDNGWMQVGVR